MAEGEPHILTDSQARTIVTKESGEVAEWLNAPVSKTGLPARVAGVRISPSPYQERRKALILQGFSALCTSWFFGVTRPDQINLNQPKSEKHCKIPCKIFQAVLSSVSVAP